MIIQFLMNEEHLTNAEKSISHYLLNKENNINHLTSSELGKLSYTSQAAVTRLYKKLGYKNFREFLSRLIIERKEFFSFSEIEEDRPEDYLATFEDVQGVITSLYLKSIMRTNSKLDKNVINRLVNYLMSAQTIDVYGQGVSESSAKQLVYKLQSLGLPCAYQMHLIPKYIENMRNTKQHVAIIFCVDESRVSMRELASLMKERGIYTLTVTCHASDPILEMTSDYLMFDTSTFTDVDHLTSTFSAEYVTNIIYATLFYRIGLEKYKNNL